MGNPGALSGVQLLSRASAYQGPMVGLARLYAEARVPVLPCDPETKRPLTGRGFQSRSADLETVERWWARSPNALVGIVPADLGLAALDVDSTKAANAARDAGLLTGAALVVETGGTSVPFEVDGDTVKPLHVYLPVSANPPRVKDLVIRYDRGYVIAPGSRRPNGRTWLESTEGLGSWATRPPSAFTAGVAGVPPNEGTRDVAGSVAAPGIDRLRKAVEFIPNTAETSRETWIEMAHMIRGACPHGQSAECLAIFMEWSGKWPNGDDPVEDERVFTTIVLGNVRVGWPALWGLAESHGYDATEERLADAQSAFLSPTDATITSASGSRASLYDALAHLHDSLQRIDDPLQREAARVQRLAVIGRALRIPLHILQERLAAFDAPHRQARPRIMRPGPMLRDELSAAPPASLVAGYVFAEMQHILYGTPQSFKTFVALDLAMHVASGRPWLGRIPVRRRGVVFFAGEGARGVRVRVAAWLAARGITVEQATALPFALVEGLPTLDGGEDGLRDAIDRVKEASAEFGDPVGLLVFDNMTRLAAVAGLSTTDPGEYGRILASMDALGRDSGSATLTIYHSPVSDPKRPSGTYQSTANPDVIMKAQRSGTAMSTRIEVEKSRSAQAPPDVQLELRVQDVHGWLTNSYDRAGVAWPPSLIEAASNAFHDVTSENGIPANERVPAGVDFVQETREEQFTSLVVQQGHNAEEGINHPDGDADAILERRVLQALAVEPGASQRSLRAALRGTRSIDVDHVVGQLIQQGIIDDRRKGTAHAYHLTGSGQKRIQATNHKELDKSKGDT